MFANPFPVQNLSTVSIGTIGDDYIPANLFGASRIEFISLGCANENKPFLIDTRAFENTADFTTHFQVWWCNVTDFGFLRGMSALKILHLDHVITKTPRDISQYLASHHLTEFICSNCNLVGIPSNIHNLTELTRIVLNDNPIDMLIDGALHLKSMVFEINLENCPITSVRANAFGGDFRNTSLILANTLLRTLAAPSFKDVLYQMDQGTGYIELNRGIYQSH